MALTLQRASLRPKVPTAALRQPTCTLRTYILTAVRLPIYAAALGASYDLHAQSVLMQGLKIEQCHGTQVQSNLLTATIGSRAACNLTPPL